MRHQLAYFTISNNVIDSFFLINKFTSICRNCSQLTFNLKTKVISTDIKIWSPIRLLCFSEIFEIYLIAYLFRFSNALKRSHSLSLKKNCQLKWKFFRPVTHRFVALWPAILIRTGWVGWLMWQGCSLKIFYFLLYGLMWQPCTKAVLKKKFG